MKPEVCKDVETQVEALRRGAVDLISETELRAKLERAALTGKPLVIKTGFDPTATNRRNEYVENLH